MSKLGAVLIAVVLLCAGLIAGVLIADDGEKTGETEAGSPTTKTDTLTSTTVEEPPPKGEDPEALRRLAKKVAVAGADAGHRGKRAAIADELRYLTVLDESAQTLSVAADRAAAVARGHRVRRSAAIPQRRRLAGIIARLRDEARRLSKQTAIAANAGISPPQRARVARHRNVLIETLDAAADQLQRQRGLPGLTRAELRARSRKANRRVRLQLKLELQRSGRIAQRSSVQLERSARQIRVDLKRAVLRAATVGGSAGRRVLRRLHEKLASLPPGWPMFPPLRDDVISR
jgi:hypothetical protein